MNFYSDNRPVRISDTNGKFFEAACSHIKDVKGKHLFVIAIAPGEDAQKLLEGSRRDLSAFVKEGYGVGSNKDLDYMEVQPDGNLFWVNLENLGRGPSVHGEPEHLKSKGSLIPQAAVMARLGNVHMPVPSPTPLTSAIDKPDAQPETKWSEGSLPLLPKTGRQEIQNENKPVQKQKLKL